MNNYLKSLGKNSNTAFNSKINKKIKNKVLYKYASLIKKNKFKIINQNNKDIILATKKGLKKNLLDRLRLDNYKLDKIIKSIKTIAKLKDPIDVTLSKWKRPNGLIIKRVTIPIGIIGVIYESRPNVTSDISSLCFKSGNCVILKGGSEAYFSNKILSNYFRKSLKYYSIDENYVQFIESKNRKLVDLMLSNMEKYIDIYHYFLLLGFHMIKIQF